MFRIEISIPAGFPQGVYNLTISYNALIVTYEEDHYLTSQLSDTIDIITIDVVNTDDVSNNNDSYKPPNNITTDGEDNRDDFLLIFLILSIIVNILLITTLIYFNIFKNNVRGWNIENRTELEETNVSEK
jgi:hypothetical protein